MAKKKSRQIYGFAAPNVWRVSKTGTDYWCIKISIYRQIVIGDHWFQVYPDNQAESRRIKRIINSHVTVPEDSPDYRRAVTQAVHDFVVMDMGGEDGAKCLESLLALPGFKIEQTAGAENNDKMQEVPTHNR